MIRTNSKLQEVARAQTPGRTSYRIGGAQGKMKMQNPFFKNC